MNPRNQAWLRREIAAAGTAAVARKGYVTAIDALLATGWLRPEKVENWRRGRVPYLEQVTVASLPKISAAMRIFRSWAERAGLRPSETAYVSQTRDRRRLQFSKSGDPNIERAYRTHWLPPKPNTNG
ncbi:MAG: hypothetical protein GEV28_06135 [Actinophytocola sp.]|uniref:hypothetical protein n=1 Tax=Actinophytocola sp. TaxID=1872138 RepID=UPI001324CF9F|nr:hypothetical protein [Actinophytocola sp.]MPZ79988.1 hypothetical protein [Actinophytocola sp.]